MPFLWISFVGCSFLFLDIVVRSSSVDIDLHWYNSVPPANLRRYFRGPLPASTRHNHRYSPVPLLASTCRTPRAPLKHYIVTSALLSTTKRQLLSQTIKEYSALTLVVLWSHCCCTTGLVTHCITVVLCHRSVLLHLTSVTMSNLYTQIDWYVQKYQHCGVHIYHVFKHSDAKVRF